MDHDAERDPIEEEYQRTFMEREGREELADQLRAEHRAGMAAERLEQEQRRFQWDIEGWDHDELRMYIPGFGLMIIPADEVRRLGNALLAEHQLHTEEEW